MRKGSCNCWETSNILTVKLKHRLSRSYYTCMYWCVQGSVSPENLGKCAATPTYSLNFIDLTHFKMGFLVLLMS